MKKGCFLKIIIILTVLIAGILYIFENHFKDFVLKPGEGIIKNIVFKNINGKLENVKDTPEKDSLMVFINNLIHDRIQYKHQLDSKEFEDIADSIEMVLSDSVISQVELRKLKSLFNLKETNEGSKEN